MLYIHTNTHTHTHIYIQHICDGVIKCRPAHGRPVLPYGPIANNRLSEHIHRMLLSDMAATTEQLQGKYMGLMDVLASQGRHGLIFVKGKS